MTTSGGSKATATSTITTGSRVMVKSQNVLTRTDRPRDVCETGCIIYGHSIYQQWWRYSARKYGVWTDGTSQIFIHLPKLPCRSHTVWQSILLWESVPYSIISIIHFIENADQITFFFQLLLLWSCFIQVPTSQCHPVSFPSSLRECSIPILVDGIHERRIKTKNISYQESVAFLRTNQQHWTHRYRSNSQHTMVLESIDTHVWMCWTWYFHILLIVGSRPYLYVTILYRNGFPYN